MRPVLRKTHGVKKFLHTTLGVWCAVSAQKISGPMLSVRITALNIKLSNSDIIIQTIKCITENTVQTTSLQEPKDDRRSRFFNTRVTREVFLARPEIFQKGLGPLRR
jgi:hypothetical protein